jgi:hypothetical protein
MKWLTPSPARLRKGISLAIGFTATLWLITAVGLLAADSKPAKEAREEKTEKKTEKKKLSGAELYSLHCNRCHPERYATERTAAQWKTIMLHMRVRANLPADQAKAILKYLQEDSGK